MNTGAKNRSPHVGNIPIEASEHAELTVTQFPTKPKFPKNTDSGYHGTSEDEMYTDEVEADIAPPLHILDGAHEAAYFGSSPHERADHSHGATERATTTEGSFHSAREEPVESEDARAQTQKTFQATETQSLLALIRKPSPDAPVSAAKPSCEEDIMQLDEVDAGSILDDPINESRSPSQGSTPVKTLIRKSSLNFAALPAREPLTTKKSIGTRVSRTSHVDQARNALSRGSFLERFTSGKSFGAARQTGADDGIDSGETEIDDKTMAGPDREYSDGDVKMATLHNKSSTQRLHDRITMLGKSQPTRPTKSIPTAAVSTNPSYPDLPQVDVQIHPTQRSPQPPKPIAKPIPDDDDDDWIKPPPAGSDPSSRPQLPKSTTVDVMENIRGKQKIGDEEFGPGYYDEAAFKEPSPSRPNAIADQTMGELGLARSASAALLASPSKPQISSGVDHLGMGPTSAAAPGIGDQFVVSTTPAGTPRSKQNVDGPLSASKSKLQSIMKTARGLFTSSAGVSAQAKIEALSSPLTRTRSKLQETASNASVQSVHPVNQSTAPVPQVPNPDSPTKQPKGRKTRSSTEKEGKRKEQEARANAPSKESAKHGPEDLNQPPEPARQSPRRVQKQTEARQGAEDNENRPSNMNGVGTQQSMGPPQSQVSQLQRPKEPRRPMKPVKEAASKPRPQVIRVDTLSRPRIPLSNAALSSSLQDSLPATQGRPPGLVKKASNASIQTSASNSSLKPSVTSGATKPKALLAAERKKEQVSRPRSSLLRFVLNTRRMKRKHCVKWNKNARWSASESHSKKSSDSRNGCNVRKQSGRGSESGLRRQKTRKN